VRGGTAQGCELPGPVRLYRPGHFNGSGWRQGLVWRLLLLRCYAVTVTLLLAMARAGKKNFQINIIFILHAAGFVVF